MVFVIKSFYNDSKLICVCLFVKYYINNYAPPQNMKNLTLETPSAAVPSRQKQEVPKVQQPVQVGCQPCLLLLLLVKLNAVNPETICVHKFSQILHFYEFYAI